MQWRNSSFSFLLSNPWQKQKHNCSEKKTTETLGLKLKKIIQLDYNFLPIIKPSVVRTHCERIRLNFLWNSVPVNIVNMGDNEVYPCKYFVWKPQTML